MTVRRPPTNAFAQLAERIHELEVGQITISVLRIVTDSPLTVDLRGTVVPAVGIAGLTYPTDPEDGPFHGLAFIPTQGMPVVFPRAD